MPVEWLVFEAQDGYVLDRVMCKSKYKTPCIGICSATALGDEICVGCGRTFDEVIKWNQMPNEEKAEVKQRARERVKGRS